MEPYFKGQERWDTDVLAHFGQEDALTVHMFVKKHDQEGKDVALKHVFVNQANPWICPVLALAVYIFTSGPLLPCAKMLVFANDAAEDFCDPTKRTSVCCRQWDWKLGA
eukprot:2055160-Rhodomonas_salina.1